MSVSIVFYLMVFLVSIGVFGNAVTENLAFPTIELAKRVDIPGAIFERIDTIVFTIWIMAIFNTAAVTLDIAVLLLTSIFHRANKKMITFILSPIVYYIALFPQQFTQVQNAANFLSLFHIIFIVIVIFGLFAIAKLRGVRNEK